MGCSRPAVTHGTVLLFLAVARQRSSTVILLGTGNYSGAPKSNC